MFIYELKEVNTFISILNDRDQFDKKKIWLQEEIVIG